MLLLKHNRQLRKMFEQIRELYNVNYHSLKYVEIRVKILQNYVDIKSVSKESNYKYTRKRQKMLTKTLKNLVRTCIDLILIHQYQYKDESYRNTYCFVKYQDLRWQYNIPLLKHLSHCK